MQAGFEAKSRFAKLAEIFSVGVLINRDANFRDQKKVGCVVVLKRNDDERNNTGSEGPCLQLLHEKAVVFLTDVVAGALQTETVEMETPFDEMGVDSFLTLTMIRTLEDDFGTLPKTLFFEYFDLQKLADYFVENHATVLARLVGLDAAQQPNVSVLVPVETRQEPVVDPVILHQDELDGSPELQSLAQDLFESHGREAVSLARLDIAPFLFIASKRDALFTFNRDRNLFLGFNFVGPEASLPGLIEDLMGFCQRENLEMNLLCETPLSKAGSHDLTATPFAAVQRLDQLQGFGLSGGAMRRLRYMVTRFEKLGSVETKAYQVGDDAATDRDILGLIDAWCTAKNMVNPYVYNVRAQIEKGRLRASHRLFLTYLDGAPQNAILIAEMPDLNGYLMDLEFYGPHMPLGGLEFAICAIIGQLAEEGCSSFSLGATFGARLGDSPCADPAVESLLASLRQQGVFDGMGNLQFKNKFRPKNSNLFLCRPAGTEAGSVSDVLLMIANPPHLKQPVRKPKPDRGPVLEKRNKPKVVPFKERQVESPVQGDEQKQRAADLESHGFNPHRIPSSKIDLDLVTDSWAELSETWVHDRVQHLSGLQMETDSVEALARDIFSFEHTILVSSGRHAESLLCEAWPKKHGRVVGNILWPTFLYHQAANGFNTVEMPVEDAFRKQSATPFKGNLDTGRLETYLKTHEVDFACIEVGNNGTGGHPVSLANLARVKQVLKRYGVPLIIDATRIVENAFFLMAAEKSPQSDLWQWIREICRGAHGVTCSLTKDFGIHTGGLIATNDPKLARALAETVAAKGSGLGVLDKQLLARAMADRPFVERAVRERMTMTATIHQALAQAGLPVVGPAGGHCILLDPGTHGEGRYGLQAYLASLFQHTGIRAGIHSAGTQKGSALNGLIRLAVPVGMTPSRTGAIINRLVDFHRSKFPLPSLTLESRPPGLFGQAKAVFTLAETKSQTPVKSAPKRKPKPEKTPAPRAPEPGTVTGARSQKPDNTDIAVIGLSGRYPQAPNLKQFAENLLTGRDCITREPLYRWGETKREGDPEARWGGFLEDVDAFDSLFFNISPRDAQNMDPHERLFLQTAWHAVEDAGYRPHQLGGPDQGNQVGVFVGAVWAHYVVHGAEETLKGNPVRPNSYLFSISNRVSACMNLTGPSFTVDTACSASLTALHLACESLQKGDCRAAIVGGVNLDLHGCKFLLAEATGVLSPEGRCHTFGSKADGYVAGEGVGAAVLKPLDQALRDGDHVYGVIKGSAINHAGKTSGYGVPNPGAQGDLIVRSLERSAIDPKTVGYVETHGTGTKLGDPVEFKGLCNAFGRYEVQPQSIAIGSVKTNIGHLEAAAGIAGLTKVLLQFQHRKLAPSLHSEPLNELIDFENSPFRVQREGKPWEQQSADGKPLPLRAGLSSFGLGGANAHVVLESFSEASKDAAVSAEKDGHERHAFLLSARDEDRLREMAALLRDFLKQKKIPSLADMAHTLKVGRVTMDHRLALIADNRESLVRAVEAYLAGKDCENWISGVASNGKSVNRLLNGKAREAMLTALAAEGDLTKLAGVWADGIARDWDQFQLPSKGRRVSLPTYPFERRTHWLPKSGKTVQSQTTSGPSALHPLIDFNGSTFGKQIFVKRCNAREFFMKDHVIAGLPTLPGVGYLEMARAAGQLAGGRRIFRLMNQIQARPITSAEHGLDIQIALSQNQNGAEYEIFSTDETGSKAIYSQGKMEFCGDSEPKTERVDLDVIRARCTEHMDRTAIYDYLRGGGIAYEETFKAISELRYNHQEALSTLSYPAPLGDDFGGFQLHPSLMDGATQSVAGLLSELAGGIPYVPFVFGEVAIYRPLTRKIYAHVQVVDFKSGKKPTDIRRFHIHMVSPEGDVLVHLKNFTLKAFKPMDLEGKPDNPVPVRTYRPVWRREPLAAGDPNHLKTLLLFDRDETLRAALKRHLPHGRIVLVTPSQQFDEPEADRFQINPGEPEHYQRLVDRLGETGALPQGTLHCWARGPFDPHGQNLETQLQQSAWSVFYLSKTLLQKFRETGVKDPGDLLFVHPGSADGSHPVYAAMGAMTATIQMENPRFFCRALELSTRDLNGDAARILISELAYAGLGERKIGYRSGARLVCRQEWLPELDSSDQDPLKERGAYLITGGMGGLGLIFARYLAKTYNARLVLAGRGALDSRKKKQVEELETLGAQVLYVQTDVSDLSSVKQLRQAALSRFGSVDGIFHAAGLIRDAMLSKKQPQDVKAVLAPKIHGSLNLDRVFADDRLDLFVAFSSIAGVTGNLGQCDYAYGNAFMDQFCAWRNECRTGKSLSINWPLWREGGMQLDAQSETFIAKTYGLQPLPSEAGLDTFKRALPGCQGSVLVVAGDAAKYESAFSLGEVVPAPLAHGKPSVKAQPSEQGNSQQSGDVSHGLEKAVLAELRKSVIVILGVEERDIVADANLSNLGFDSIGFTEFTNDINNRFSLDLTPVIFFEYETLEELNQYLLEDFAEALSRVVGAPEEPQATAQTVATEATEYLVEPLVADDGAPPIEAPVPNQETQSTTPEKREAIAIVGMSGVMPQSENLDAFWRNLMAGRDLVTEIPSDRWDWKAYHGDPMEEPDKTNVHHGGFMFEVDKFDAPFFGISRREAELMDPQQRLFLQTVWHTIGNAGYKPADLSGSKTGLYVGVGSTDYHFLFHQHQVEVEPYSLTGVFHTILANRISYLLNIHGPSEPLDTACSSSLAAIDRAVHGIWSGQCEAAIAGGVNVLCHPREVIALSKAGMLSPDGKCKTFDAAANGYVRGEGVGALYLKPLSRAVADGDTIHALIRSTAVNHGGRVTSITAPNPNAQADLLVDAYVSAGIDPHDIGYMEAHGTGTSLGDPIEIAGLKKAFKTLYKKRNRPLPTEPRCGIGSVKTNTGHLERAAGMAGIFKVIYAMKHGQLPPTIHQQERNPYIKLEGSPFYIVDKAQAWEPVKGEGGPKPRLAGISSFGMGGANAHLVIEESPGHPHQEDSSGGPGLFILSAKDEARLLEYARSLADWLAASHNGLPDSNKVGPSFQSITYTLQVGREALPQRLALVVSDKTELVAALKAFVADGAHPWPGIRGNPEKDGARLVGEDQEQADLLCREALRARDLETLARCWVAGLNVDWSALYGQRKPGRVPLPTHPFARIRYWIATEPKQQTPVVAEMKPARLQEPRHPLLGVREAGVADVSFQQEVNGSEFFLADHVIAGRPTLPGSAYLEAALAAVRYSGEPRFARCTDITWVRPFAGTQWPRILRTQLDAKQNRFVVEGTDANGTFRLHAEGKLDLEFRPEPQRVDLKAVRDRCHQTMDVDELYVNYKELGIHYGPTFQTLTSLRRGTDEVVGDLSLGKTAETASGFLLHPALLDGAFQAVAGLLGNDRVNETLIPFSLDAMVFHHAPGPRCTVVATRAKEAENAAGFKADLLLVDETGQVAVGLEGFMVRYLQTRKTNSKPKPQTVSFYRSRWVPLTDSAANAGTDSIGTVLLFDVGLDRYQKLKRRCQNPLVLVQPGKTFSQQNGNQFQINPCEPEHYARLFEILKKNHIVPGTCSISGTWKCCPICSVKRQH